MGWLRRLRNLCRGNRVHTDIEREIAFHLAERADEYIASGMSRDDAVRNAKLRFGNYTMQVERTRDMDIHVWMESIGRDIRYAARGLWKSPGFALVAVLTLAIGIGANTAIFSVVNGVLLRSLPYKEADRIVTVWQRNIKTGVKENGAAPGNFLDWRNANQVFARIAAAEPYTHNMAETGEPESFRSWLVTEGFFDTLGVQAFLGRTFTAEEYQPGRFVVVLGYGLWQRRFGGDPNLIGKTLRLNGQPHTVVGVMPPEFQFPPLREVWAPRPARDVDTRIRGGGYLPVVARLKPGVTLAQAQQDMDTIAGRLAKEYPQVNSERGIVVIPLREQTVGHVRPALLVLLGAVGLVLLIACTNVANLVLVRAAERQREFAIRGALGAARARLIGQWLIESLLLALVGGLAGIMLAKWGLRTTLMLSGNILPRLNEIAIDGPVLAFTVAASFLSALIFGLLPSVRFLNPSLNDALREGGRSVVARFGRSSLRRMLVVSEIALALVLLIGAGLLMRSFVKLLQVNPGFSADRVLALEVHIWGWNRTPEQQGAFFDQTLERIASLPGVVAAGAVSALPFHDNPIIVGASFTINGRPVPASDQQPKANFTSASEDYFRALAIPLLRGRFFTRLDRRGTPPVAVINETLAKQYWPSEDPVGHRITATFFGQVITPQIVGVVGDVRPAGLDSNPRPELFLPQSQNSTGSMTYVVRTTEDPLLLLPAVKKEIWAVNRNLPFASTATLEQLVSRSTGDRRFNLLLLGSFAGIALILAGIGIYGLISFSTGQRHEEIRVRMALGATQGTILRMIVGEGLLLTSLGVVIGVAGALVLTRFLQTLLFEVRPTDPLTFAGVSVLLVAVAFMASYIPARRSTKMDPNPGR
jgi:putative ABC transport system permease protein